MDLVSEIHLVCTTLHSQIVSKVDATYTVISMDLKTKGISVDVCTYTHTPATYLAVWISVLITEMTLVVLVIFKGWQEHRMFGGLSINSGSSILGRIVKGSTMYFIVYVSWTTELCHRG